MLGKQRMYAASGGRIYALQLSLKLHELTLHSVGKFHVPFVPSLRYHHRSRMEGEIEVWKPQVIESSR